MRNGIERLRACKLSSPWNFQKIESKKFVFFLLEKILFFLLPSHSKIQEKLRTWETNKGKSSGESHRLTPLVYFSILPFLSIPFQASRDQFCKQICKSENVLSWCRAERRFNSCSVVCTYQIHFETSWPHAVLPCFSATRWNKEAIWYVEGTRVYL